MFTAVAVSRTFVIAHVVRDTAHHRQHFPSTRSEEAAVVPRPAEHLPWGHIRRPSTSTTPAAYHPEVPMTFDAPRNGYRSLLARGGDSGRVPADLVSARRGPNKDFCSMGDQ
jgi:hypothetical protein